MAKKKFGFDLLAKQAAQAVESRVSIEMEMIEAGCEFPGDTPIEKLLHAALTCRLMFGKSLSFRYLIGLQSDSYPSDEIRKRVRTEDTIIWQKQFSIEGIGRVDFLFHAWADWALEPEGRLPGWRRLIVECDGHDFHERTKEQAANDRSRDRAATLKGFEVFRFTGSELWRDPWGCADQIVKWADRGA